MCGIFGWAIKPGVLPIKSLEILGIELAGWNDTRGGDSWGIYGLAGDKKKPIIRKGLGLLEKYGSQLSAFRILMAHTRKATGGAVSAEITHPFVCGHIVGSHNGMVYNHQAMNDKYNRNFVVDSNHIFEHLRHGLPLDDLAGYGSLHWVDMSVNKEDIYLCKASRGDLAAVCLGTDDPDTPKKDTAGIAWSSDIQHLKVALGVAEIPHFEYQVEKGEVLKTSKYGLFITPLRLEFGKSYKTSNRSRWEHLSDKPFGEDGLDAFEEQCGMDKLSDEDIQKAVLEEQSLSMNLWARKTVDHKLR